MQQPGLKPGLLQKYQAARTADDKWALLKAFMLDPSMQSVEVETMYTDQAEHDDASQWVELPLSQLRKLYTSPEEKAFLEREIIGKQGGRPHPQDSTGQDKEMRMYWAFREATDTSRNKQAIGTKLSARGSIPDNKAARQTLADGLAAAATTLEEKVPLHELSQPLSTKERVNQKVEEGSPLHQRQGLIKILILINCMK
ncbi:unnamed protein product [Cladocopium goreaui]|uniref:Uncharacterized protein n=1 Tax=Cladocopium goreaui TaxID=2562237 RepID=A0A9P1BKF9_9DINO|nr:unnamed protein product [Cladocopium goreaui]